MPLQVDDSFYQTLSKRSARLTQSMLEQRKLTEAQTEVEVRSAHL